MGSINNDIGKASSGPQACTLFLHPDFFMIDSPEGGVWTVLADVQPVEEVSTDQASEPGAIQAERSRVPGNQELSGAGLQVGRSRQPHRPLAAVTLSKVQDQDRDACHSRLRTGQPTHSNTEHPLVSRMCQYLSLFLVWTSYM